MAKEKKTIQQLYDAAIEDLSSVYNTEGLSEENKKKVAGAGELIDLILLEKTGQRNCKVGSTIP